MTPEKPDLSSLRIDRGQKEEPRSRFAGWKTYVIVSCIVVLAVAGFFFRGAIAPATEVELTTATLTFPSQANAALTASGYVVAQRKAAVASKGTGRLVSLKVEEGDKVYRNEVIAQLEDSDVLAALQKAKADVAVAIADRVDAEQTLARTKRLFTSALASQADLDAAQARYERVTATIESAKAGLVSAEVGLENTRIRAPFDGTVLTKDADVGEVVAPFASSANSRGAVVTIADMASLQVEADVSESNITKVKSGQPCEIVLDAYPDKRYQGSVYKIVPTADRAKATVLTKVAFKIRDERVLPEMSAKVTFLMQESDEASLNAPPKITVPSSAVVTRSGATVVLLVKNDKIVEQPVRTGATMGSRLEILEGLIQGDQVVARPDPALSSGTRVKTQNK